MDHAAAALQYDTTLFLLANERTKRSTNVLNAEQGYREYTKDDLVNLPLYLLSQLISAGTRKEGTHQHQDGGIHTINDARKRLVDIQIDL